MMTSPRFLLPFIALLCAGCFQPLGILGQGDSGTPHDGGATGDGGKASDAGCSDPNDAGTCVNGQCTGCVDGSEACQVGNVPWACGTGGAVCAVCSSGESCTDGQCVNADGGLPNCTSGPSLPTPNACYFSDAGTDFPPPENCCTTDTDCTVSGYEWTCCGQYVAIGMNVAAYDNFLSNRVDWSCAACGCALGGVKTQDGLVVAGFAEVAVSCVQGQCLTHATPDGGAVCQPIGATCLSSADCCSQNCNLGGTCCTPGGCP